MSLNSHIQVWVKIIKDERSSYSDGLTQRFLINSPEPLFKQTFKQQHLVKRQKTSMAVILYFIKQLNKDHKLSKLKVKWKKLNFYKNKRIKNLFYTYLLVFVYL